MFVIDFFFGGGGFKKNKVNLILNVYLFIKFCEKKYLGYGFS